MFHNLLLSVWGREFFLIGVKPNLSLRENQCNESETNKSRTFVNKTEPKKTEKKIGMKCYCMSRKK